jgi:hypothetical protein
VTGPDEQPAEDAGVLSSLPGTRPQRRSPKRPAAKPSRRAGQAAAEAGPTDTPPPGATPDAAAAEPRRRRPPKASPVPPAQGFEPEPLDGSVDPPTGAELVNSLAKGAVELADLGLTLSRRLTRSLLDRLPRL